MTINRSRTSDLHQSFKSQVRLNWKFLNAVKAIMQPGSTIYPCPICLVYKDDFFKPTRARKETDKHSRHPYQPLLQIPADDIVPLPLHVMLHFVNIVPLPLHVMLGFVNKINMQLKKRKSLDTIKDMVSTIKTVHTRGGGGAADIHDLIMQS